MMDKFPEFNVIPVKQNSKLPAIEWAKYQRERYPRDQLTDWNGNFAVVCGRVSNNLVVIDFDDPNLYQKFFGDIRTLTIRTPTGGFHVYLYSEGEQQKKPKFGGLPIDIQGEGSIALIPSSTINGKAYEIVRDESIMRMPSVEEFLRPRLPINTRGSSFEEFKGKVDISSVIEKCVEKSREGKGYWQAICPFHGDTDPSFTVYDRNFHCFGCGTHGDVIDFVEKREGVDKWKAIEKITSITGVEFPAFLRRRHEGGKEEISHGKVAELIMEDRHFRTFSDTKEILTYRDGVYVFGGEAEIMTEVERIMETTKTAKTASNNFVNEVVGHIRRRTLTDRDAFQSSPFILNLKNGLLDIRTMEFVKHKPDFLSLNQIPVNYDKKAKCPKIKRFFHQIVAEDDIPILEEWFGYSLFRDYSIHKALMCLGGGENGKSTCLNLLGIFVGKENSASVSLQDLDGDRFASSGLHGKLVNICADIPSRGLSDTGKFKMLTGQDRIRAEKKFQQDFTFVNYAKLAYSANKIPETPDDTDAFFRRWIILNFPNRFEGENRDPHLLEKLTAEKELSGLLNVAMKGMKRLLRKGGFSDSSSTDDIRRRYILSSDPVAAFISDCLEPASEAVISKDEMYNSFLEYCHRTGLLPIRKEVFGHRFKEKGVRDERPETDSGRVYCWKGFRFKTSETAEHIPQPEAT